MNKLKKLKWLLLIPGIGIILVYFYIYKKNKTKPKFIKKHNLSYFLVGLTFVIGFIIFALILRLINNFIDIRDFALAYGVYFGLLFGYYIADIPCYIYMKKFINDFENLNNNDNVNNENCS